METGSADMTTAPARRWRVLVLEDDEILREHILLPGLADHGFHATGVGSAADLYRHMLSSRYDIALLDVGLPGEDGITVARHLRQLSPMGIVMLTGNHGRDDHLRALIAGADAYLSKPVDIEVLAASLYSLARRLQTPDGAPSGKERELERQGDGVKPLRKGWRLETDDWCLFTPGNASIALSGSERCVMQQLMMAKSTAVSREHLIATLSRNIYDFDPHRLEMLVHRLRRKVREHGEVLPLMTIRGTGYAFVVEQGRVETDSDTR